MKLPPDLEADLLARGEVGPKAVIPPPTEMTLTVESRPAGPVTLYLPWGPSTNHHWVPVIARENHHSYARLVLSENGAAFREQVGAIIRSLPNPPRFGTARLGMTLVVHPPNRREVDIGNRLKATEDALQAAGVFKDDEQIDLTIIRRGNIVPGGRLDVTLWELQ